MYALCMANDVINETPSLHNYDNKSPHAVFSGYQVEQNYKHWKQFVCQVYVLDSALQSIQPQHKWSEQ